ncbi:unnamed protein product [Mucor hiemalis]
MRDPVILIEGVCSMPITCKPLPALLAPPSPLNRQGSLSSFASSASSTQQQQLPEEHTYLQQQQQQQQPNNNYYTLIQKQSLEIQDLRQDLIKLNQKYIHQIDRIQIAEQAQFQVESELEDLSSKLFEEANEMVAQEKKARFLAEKRVAHLERELSGVYEALDYEREQLRELRAKFAAAAVDDTTSVTPTEEVHPLSVVEDDDKSSIASFTPFNSNNIHLDHGWLTLFKDFIRLAPDTPLESIHRLPFMKQCLELDIAPCLRFGNNLKWGKLSMKKVLEAVIKQPCFIESDHSPQKRHSHDDISKKLQPATVARRSSFAIFRSALMTVKEEQYACHGCGNTTGTTAHLFRFKLKETDTEWVWIDRSCRDRLVAVCNFYVFIRQVRQGLQSQKTLDSLFQECVWLRLVMFWARSGVHHLVT